MGQKICPDTSIIIDGKINETIKKKKLKDVEIILPVAALEELQAQASKGKESGFIGLDKLKELRKICKKRRIKIKLIGEKPSLEDIKLSKSGRIDSLIRDVAKKENAILYTADYIQALVAEVVGIKTFYLPPEIKTSGLTFEQLLTPDTLSLHLKEGIPPFAKRGKPGKFELVKVSETPIKKEEIETIVREITEAVRISKDAFVEISEYGATVMQLGNFRVAIARPPFSDGLEVTIVRPTIKLSLEDYKLSEKLVKRLKEKAEGILIAGPPGSGKSSFASSLAEFYSKEKNAIVKTLESPRDLQVGPEITQYAPIEKSFSKTAEILLLVRPDYTIFDEIRKIQDFQTFAELRLAGVGMVGVVHSCSAIDAIQRFIGKIELGMIPHIIDTLIFIEAGEIKKVYELSLCVKIPTGMTEADLARPVVEVRDFETKKLEYEIYTFGEENVIIKVEEKESPLKRLAAERILQEVRKFDSRAEVNITSENVAIVRVANEIIPRLIGKNGTNISQIEKRLGIRIEVEPRLLSLNRVIEYKIEETGNSIGFIFDRSLANKLVNFYVDEDFLFSATIGKKGKISVTKDSDIGRKLVSALVRNKKIKALV